MTTAEVQRMAAGLGLDAVGVARAEPYERTERDIRERKARGLFGRLGFTTTRPEVSCHPEKLLEGARTVVSAALCYYVPEPELPPGHGRLPRYAWHDGYAELREKLDALGRSLEAPYRVLVDANQHVDREAAARSGVGFYGKNTLLITERHGSWVVLGTLVTTLELEPTAPMSPGCGSCTRCIDACPTGALDEPGVLDATRCLSYWTQVPEPIPEPFREPLGSQVYGCDICQDVCPWNRGVERRRAGLEPDPAAHVDLLAVLGEGLGLDEDLLRRLYVPRNDPRWLQRNALVALGNTAENGSEVAAALAVHAGGDDELLADHARWAQARLEQRCS
ncbi:MAG TPA: tRNA epoxyqueuosine(34) reductase QueG [Gaiellaceae bacterium]|nr:tRNA epoxyqueuosine(34) reductase QueG [Gaiellaceae bacterium]